MRKISSALIILGGGFSSIILSLQKSYYWKSEFLARNFRNFLWQNHMFLSVDAKILQKLLFRSVQVTQGQKSW